MKIEAFSQTLIDEINQALHEEKNRTEIHPGVCYKCQGEIVRRRQHSNRGVYQSDPFCGNCGLSYPKAKSWVWIGLTSREWNELLNTPFTI